MATRRMANGLVRIGSGIGAVLAISTGSGALATVIGAGPARADVCYNGTPRLNPYLPSCSIPGPANKIRGSAPDANAIIACRGVPGCLAYYVNSP